MISCRIDAVIEHQHVEGAQHGIERVFVVAMPLRPFLRRRRRVFALRTGAVAEAHHHGALCQKLPTKGLPQGPTNAGDADSQSLPRGLGT